MHASVFDAVRSTSEEHACVITHTVQEMNFAYGSQVLCGAMPVRITFLEERLVQHPLGPKGIVRVPIAEKRFRIVLKVQVVPVPAVSSTGLLGTLGNTVGVS